MDKQYLTISELARLMDVSVHQIRYFEEKGVLLPSHIGENLYRLYSVDQMYQLSHILLQRKLGLSVAQIAEGLKEGHEVNQMEILASSLAAIDKEIAELQKRKQLIEKINKELADTASNRETIVKKYCEALHLVRWLKLGEDHQLYARMFLEQARRIPAIFERDIYYIQDEKGDFSLYVEVEAEEFSDLTIPAGHCLVKHFTAVEDDDFIAQLEPMQQYALEKGLIISQSPVLIEKSYLSLFSGNELHYECRFYLDEASC